MWLLLKLQLSLLFLLSDGFGIPLIGLVLPRFFALRFFLSPALFRLTRLLVSRAFSPPLSPSFSPPALVRFPLFLSPAEEHGYDPDMTSLVREASREMSKLYKQWIIAHPRSSFDWFILMAMTFDLLLLGSHNDLKSLLFVITEVAPVSSSWLS